jgi:hypothetical protein
MEGKWTETPFCPIDFPDMTKGIAVAHGKPTDREGLAMLERAAVALNVSGRIAA